MLTADETKKKYRVSDEKLLDYIQNKSTFKKILYLNLGVKTVRLICYDERFIPHIKKQLTYVLRENSDNFDTTIVMWHENDVENLYKNQDLIVYDENAEEKGLVRFDCLVNTIYSYASNINTYFWGVNNFETEEFIKTGHIFVQIFSKILKTKTTNLVHGACIGLNNTGILLCARGQRGKSTLSVLSMLEGFEYVSDDYLTLEKIGDELFAYPIYSIITLSPRMYNELYDKLDGTRFISNSTRKDKYTLNIANFHNKFRTKYPVKLCMSLEFTQDNEPSVKECTQQEKGNAITQMVHSTITQMGDMFDSETIKKIIEMISNFKYYKIYLCKNIYKNVQCLKKFMEGYENDQLQIK